MIVQTLNAIFTVLFFVIGLLNLLLVHSGLGIIYIVLGLVFAAPKINVLDNRYSFVIPPLVKVIIGFVVLWGTLAVGDLAEIIGL